jgi:hypothetical protein
MMKLRKMTMASLLVFAGLAACGAVRLAAQSQAPDGASSAGTNVRELALAVRPAAEARPDDDPMTSYPTKIDPDKVREYPELIVKYRNFQLSTGPVAVVPIDCERGMTGAVIIGNGKFHFTPEKSKSIEGAFRAVMLRFNPADQAAIISLDKGKKVRDVGATEMSRHLLTTALRHCYHRGGDVLIPSKGTFAAVLYSKEHGDLLISDAGKEIVAFNFTSRKTLYERK